MECAPDGRVERSAVAVAGVAATPIRLTAAETALKGQKGDAGAFAKAAADCAGIPAIGDVHGSAEYRKKVAAAMVRRALADAYRRATAKNG
jgi:aerobic carbon-monoxide dehydrogenase medium subunit